MHNVTLSGISPIMFDRYPGENETTLPPREKMYFAADGKTVVMPCHNIYAMLGSNFRDCATKRKYGKQHGKYTTATQGFIDITPLEIAFLRDGNPIEFHEFGEDGFVIDRSTARVKKSASQLIPNPVTRPILKLPWSLQLGVTIIPNDLLNEDCVRQLFTIGGLYIGIGSWRGRFGKFEVESWE